MPPDLKQIKDLPGGSKLIAYFDDGTTASVPGMTVDMVVQSEKQKTQRSGDNEPLFEMVHPATHHTVTIRIRYSRVHQLSLYEQSRQIDQIVLWPFANGSAMPYLVDDEHPIAIEPTDPVVKKCLEFMRPFAEDYASGRKALVEMKKERAAAMATYKKANPCKKVDMQNDRKYTSC